MGAISFTLAPPTVLFTRSLLAFLWGTQALQSAVRLWEQQLPHPSSTSLLLCTLAGFIDSDEYIILRPDIPSLPALLQRYEQYGALAVFSKTFGSSGHKTRPAVGTRRGFTKCAPPEKVCSVATRSGSSGTDTESLEVCLAGYLATAASCTAQASPFVVDSLFCTCCCWHHKRGDVAAA